jgi:hypothetical protein
VPGNWDHERGATLAIQTELLLVAEPSADHGAVHLEEIVLGETELRVAVGRRLDSLSHPKPSL